MDEVDGSIPFSCSILKYPIPVGFWLGCLCGVKQISRILDVSNDGEPSTILVDNWVKSMEDVIQLKESGMNHSPRMEKALVLETFTLQHGVIGV